MFRNQRGFYRGISSTCSQWSQKAAPPPMTFQQLVQLSDGSIFSIKTTSPKPILRLPKDTRNNPLWNPHLNQTLDDESGQLRRFQKKFEGMDEMILDEFDMSEFTLKETVKKGEIPKPVLPVTKKYPQRK